MDDDDDEDDDVDALDRDDDASSEDGDADSDDELEAEMAALEAIRRERREGRNRDVGAKTFANNAEGLSASVEGACETTVWTVREGRRGMRGEGARGRRPRRARTRRGARERGLTRTIELAGRDVDFQWTHKAKWIDHMAITGSNTERVVDVNDDLARETFFYERALESANECVRRLKELGLPVRRPDDYYAEMVKSDEHMKRVRSELLFEQQQLEIREERRKAREAKKYGKQVQAEKVKQRTLEKKAQIKNLDKWRKQRQKSGFADDGKAPFEGAGGEGKRKRAERDSKYGFGGRKKVRYRILDIDLTAFSSSSSLFLDI